jgi:hypothetical protein
LLLFSLTISLTGCTVCKIIARGNQPIILNTLPEKYTVLGHFSKEKSFYFDYTRAPDLSSFIREATAAYPNADAVVNVFVEVKSTIGDFFMNLFTIGFANAYTINVDGDVIKYAK